MSAETDIYDVEGAIEAAAKALFPDQVKVYTPGGDVELQKVRPRFEVIAVLGAWTGKRLTAAVGATTLVQTRECAWEFKLQVEVITESAIKVHREYVAKGRAIMARFCPAVNGVSLLNHQIMHPVATLSSSPTYKDADGFYRTTLTYSGKVSVQNDKWDALVAEENL